MNSKPAGYTYLKQHYHLVVIDNWHLSYIRPSGTRQLFSDAGKVTELFPPSYDIEDDLGAHIEFALKYDGINLAILSSLFKAVESSEIAGYVKMNPRGKYKRKTWYLYELLTGEILPLDDLPSLHYYDLLEPGKYYTSSPIVVRRQLIRDNLLGNQRFCPTVRRTDLLAGWEESDLAGQCQRVIATYPPETLQRALTYLYTKETKSSFEIERLEPGQARKEKFVRLLRRAEKDDFLTQANLVTLQNEIVDERYRDPDIRPSQNYVGETIPGFTERVHFVPPKPEDLPDLMDGLIEAHQRLKTSYPVVHAAAISFGFVYLHPFNDGNGRIHRFLIHNILSRRGFTPDGVIFPVSAPMLADHGEYDRALEEFSNPLLELLDYDLDAHGELTVKNESALHYRYIDFTTQTETLFKFIQKTVESDFPNELTYIFNYDTAKRGIQEIVDMPDRDIDRFIQFCIQNSYRISPRKREKFFSKLHDAEIVEMEAVVQDAYAGDTSVQP